MRMRLSGFKEFGPEIYYMVIPNFKMYEETDPVEIAKSNERHRKLRLNCDWVNANSSIVYSHRGKYVCVAGQELFVGERMAEVLALARVAHPDDDAPFVNFVPEKRLEAIYAN